MKNIISAIYQPKKQEAINKILDQEFERFSQTHAKNIQRDKHEYKLIARTQQSQEKKEEQDPQPMIRILNVQSDTQDTQNKNAPRTREVLLTNTVFTKLEQNDEQLQLYQKQASQHEIKHKQQQQSIFDQDFTSEQRQQMPFAMIFDAVEQLYKSKFMYKDLEKLRNEFRDLIVKGIGNKMIPQCSLTYDLVTDEAIKSKQIIDEQENRINDLNSLNQLYEKKNSELTQEVEQLRIERKSLKTEVKKMFKENKLYCSQIAKLSRTNEELQQMWNAESYKYYLDAQNTKENLKHLKNNLDEIKKMNLQLQQENKQLQSQLESYANKRKQHVQQKKDMLRSKYEEEMKDSQSLFAILKSQKITKAIAEYIGVQDYIRLSSINKRFYSELRSATGSQIMMIYMKKIIVQEKNPQFKVSYKQPNPSSYGGGVNLTLSNNESNYMLSQNALMDQMKNSFSDNSNHLSQSMMSMDNFNIQVSQGDLDKYQNNERVKQCIKKYVCDDYRVGAQSEKSILKAQNLLLSYVNLVYSQEELEKMKQECSLSLSEEKNQLNSSTMRQSISQSFGSLFSIFKPGVSQVPDKKMQQLSKKQTQNLDRSHQIGLNNSSMYSGEDQLNLSTDCFGQNQQHQINMISEGFFKKFNCPDDVYKYLVQVGTLLVVEREKITQLFKKMQQSFAELFYFIRLLFRENQDLNLLKDFFKVKVQFLKQKVQVIEKEKDEIEKCFVRERDQKDKYIERSNNLEKRCLEAQAELVMQRQKTSRQDEYKKDLEKRSRELQYLFEDTKEKLEEEIQQWRTSFENCDKQKRLLKQVLKDYNQYLQAVAEQQQCIQDEQSV